MLCRQCGTKIHKGDLRPDGLYRCPGCGKLYRAKGSSAGKRGGRLAVRRRNLVLLILGTAIAVAALTLAFAFGGGSDRKAEPAIPAPTAVAPSAEPTAAPSPTPTPEPTATPEPTPEPTAAPTPAPTRDPNLTSVRFRAVGDVMSHQAQLNFARQRDGSYNYDSQFQFVREALSKADYTIANLELTIARDNYSGYPTFRIPESILCTLKDCGIDMFTMANNHILDGFFDGLTYTLDKVDEYGFDHVGAYRTAEEAKRPVVVDIGGIKFGFLAYTETINANPNNVGAKNLAFCVGNLKTANFKADVRALRDAGAEVVVCMPHWGDEGHRIVNAACKRYAQAMVNAGVDIILGSHPHMVQPVSFGKLNVNGAEKDVLIAWSLGNFISNQTYQYEDCGIILDFTVTRDERTGEIRIRDVGYVPVYVCNTSSYITVVCSGDFYDSQPSGMTNQSYSRLRQSAGEIAAVLGESGITMLQN